MLFVVWWFFSKWTFSKNSSRNTISVKQFGSRSGLMLCQAWSGSKQLFVKAISRRQKSLIARNKLMKVSYFCKHHGCLNVMISSCWWYISSHSDEQYYLCLSLNKLYVLYSRTCIAQTPQDRHLSYVQLWLPHTTSQVVSFYPQRELSSKRINLNRTVLHALVCGKVNLWKTFHECVKSITFLLQIQFFDYWNIWTDCGPETLKQVLWQTMTTHMKCHIMQHFIRVCTVC